MFNNNGFQNIGNNIDGAQQQQKLYYLYRMMQPNANMQQQPAPYPNGYPYQQEPVQSQMLEGLVNVGKGLYNTAQQRQNDGVYKGQTVLGSGSDRDNFNAYQQFNNQLQQYGVNYNNIGNADSVGSFFNNDNSIKIGGI